MISLLLATLLISEFPPQTAKCSAPCCNIEPVAARETEIQRIISQNESNALRALSSIRYQRSLVLHNLSNLNTTGFKRMDPWTEMRDFSQGAFRQTEDQFHLAIEGNGFFEIELLDGTTAYTRDGAFERDLNGRMVTHQGFSLRPSITVDPNAVNIEINQEGIVTQQLSDGTLAQIGQIRISNFVNLGGLQLVGSNFWRETASSGNPITGETGLLRQGFLEISNVDMIQEEGNIERLRHHEEAVRFGLEAAGYRLPKH